MKKKNKSDCSSISSKQSNLSDNIMLGLSNEVISQLTKQFFKIISKKENSTKIQLVLHNLTSIILDKISPYLYTIMAILIIMFLMNCFQFYYYIKLYITTNNVLHSTSF